MKLRIHELKRDAFARLTSHREILATDCTICDLEPEDVLILSQLLEQIQLRVDMKHHGGAYLDGTQHALSINGGGGFIGLEWHCEVPSGCGGILELTEKLCALADVCRARGRKNRRNPDGSPRIDAAP